MANLFLIGGNIFQGLAGTGGGTPAGALQLPITLPFLYAADPEEGRPLANADIYIGEPDTDPEIEANRKEITLVDENGTAIPILPAGQPITTGGGGIPVYNGGRVQLFVDGNYSLKIVDSLGAQAYYANDVASIQTIDPAVLDDYALLDSPTFVGDPKAPTPAPGDNDTSISTTAYVQTELADYVTNADLVTALTPYATIAYVDAAVAAQAFIGAQAQGSGLGSFTSDGVLNLTTFPGMTEDFDTNNFLDLSTGLFEPTTAGRYKLYFAFKGTLSAGISSVDFIISIRKDGTPIREFTTTVPASGNESVDKNIEVITDFDGSTNDADFHVNINFPGASVSALLSDVFIYAEYLGA